MEYAIREVNQSLRVQVADYNYKLMVMPHNNEVIPWRGLALIGGTYSWYNRHTIGDDDVALYLHEIGHNFGFGHAMRNGEEYGDQNVVMGSGGSCFAAPHRHMMMWDQPVMSYSWNTSTENKTSWSSKVQLRNNGEFIVINDNLYLEATQNEVYGYILNNNKSTSTVCQLNNNFLNCTVENYEFSNCTGNNYNITVMLVGSESGSYLIEIQAGNPSLSTLNCNQGRTRNSAASTVLYIYEVVCVTFVTYNIILFLVAIL
jgi:hypothetical protein